MSKEESGDGEAVFKAWTTCGNCKQQFTGALQLEMARRFWRHYLSSQDLKQRYGSTSSLAISLGHNNRELAAAKQLFDAASTCVGNNRGLLLELKLHRATLLIQNDQSLEALGLLQAMLPEAKVYTSCPRLYGLAMQLLADVFLGLDRNQEAHEAAAELVAFSQVHYSMESTQTLKPRTMYAVACAKLGRVEEAEDIFEDVLATQARVFGRDHPYTKDTLRQMRTYGFGEPSG